MKLTKNEIVGFSALIVLGFVLLGYNIHSDRVNFSPKKLAEMEVKNSPSAAPIAEENEEWRRLNGEYVTDGKTVYHSLQIDPKTFVVIKDSLVKDRYRVFWKDKILGGLSPSRTRALVNKNGFLVGAADDKSVFIFTWDEAVYVKDVDALSFQLLEGNYARDKSHVIYLGDGPKTIAIIKDANPDTFQLVGTCQAVEKSYAAYAKDSRFVYVENEAIIGADASSFQLISTFSYQDEEMPMGYSFAKDNKNIFYNCGKKLEGADYATFEYIGNGIARDKNYTYNLGEFNSIRKPR